MSLQDFKLFVKERPSLMNFVNSKEKTWQDFYNMFELYGPTHNVWNKYLGITSNSPASIKDIFGLFKGIDMTEIQKGINSLTKGIDYLKDISTKNVREEKKDTYEPRPIHKYFDD